MVEDKNCGRTISTNEHYVYLYLDNKDKVKYVGYGRKGSRATSHISHTHNPKLASFISSQKFKIRIAGPYRTEEAGKAVETALISAIKPDINIAEGPSNWRFRPLGIPAHLADRMDLSLLNRRDFLTIQGKAPKPVLFVRVGEVNFSDGRVGYDPSNLPSDKQIKERVDRYWQLAKYLPEWCSNTSKSPGLLIGIHGSPGSQVIIASLYIAQNKWATVEALQNARIQIPLEQPDNLDAFGLRGRKISKEVGLKFGAIRCQFCIFLGIDNKLSGGNISK